MWHQIVTNPHLHFLVMNTLPAEIIHNIFSFLPKDSLFSCLCVNKFWHDCSQSFLYEELELESPGDTCAIFTRLTNTYEVNGGLGKWVKSLRIVLDEYDLGISPVSELLSLCSNVERIYIHHLIYDDENYNRHISPDYATLLPLCSKLRTLQGLGEAVELIAKCGARQITTLELWTVLPLTAIEGLGGNFPNLVNLRLSLDIIKVAILEDLAINCPNLDTLHLTAGGQEPITNSHSRKITISFITTLNFDIEDIDRSWVAHLAHRYPKLKRIMTSSRGNNETIDFCEIAQSCSSLSDFTCKAYNEGYAPKASFFEMLSQSAAANNGLKALCLKGNRSLRPARGSGLRPTISFGDQDLHKAATCFGGTLCFLTLQCCDNITSAGFDAALDNCHNLTNLSLSTRTGTEMELQFLRLMCQCPRLETLKLENIEIACAPSSPPIDMQTHLKSVTFEKMKTWVVVFDHIFNYCPNVSYIHLRHLCLLDQKDTRIELPHHHIRLLTVYSFDIGSSEKECEYLVELTYKFRSDMTPRTHQFHCFCRCDRKRIRRCCYCGFSQKSIEDKDIVSKLTNLRIYIGQLDDHVVGPSHEDEH
ncbi:hypothetical protein INT43_001568 [Umbelopsis isabellina]|uniref:F-box domain-containing protein n=1 Tax=Mortierella isabellina TaxID=91625 RepID=A0A8H7PDV7_MORIS|nr:hypothetical protein INT43_001568 [Umbelopsis isabellina]